MSVNIGGIDIADTLINMEFRLLVLEKIVDRLLQVAPAGVLSKKDMDDLREEAIDILKKKYPNAGITRKT